MKPCDHNETNNAPSSEHPAALGECGTNVRRHFTNNVRVLFVRAIFTRFLSVAKLLKLVVARDGIEPPTPAFSGPPTESRKWFEINGSC